VKFSANTGYNISMNKNKRKKVKSQNSVGLFKIEAHLKYLQDLVIKKLSLPNAPLYLMVRYYHVIGTVKIFSVKMQTFYSRIIYKV